MYVLDLSDGSKLPAVIHLVKDDDYKKLTKKRYFFNWKQEQSRVVYKLHLSSQDDILGLISITYIDDESRVAINLLAVAKEQVGNDKQLDRIAGNLFAHAAKLAITRYGADAAISLIPKTELGQHYIDKYHFSQAGISLFAEGKSLLKLLKEYEYV